MRSSHYFGEAEEAAVRGYLVSRCKLARDEMYTRIIHPGFSGIIEGLLRSRFRSISPQLAQDIRDEAPSYLYERIERFDPGRGKKAFNYFTQVAVRFCLFKIGKWGANKLRPLNGASGEQDATDEYDLDADDNYERLLAAMPGAHSTLTEPERIIYSMYFEEGMTQKQIAEKIGVSSYVIGQVVKSVRGKFRAYAGMAPQTSDVRISKKTINKIDKI